MSNVEKEEPMLPLFKEKIVVSDLSCSTPQHPHSSRLVLYQIISLSLIVCPSSIYLCILLLLFSFCRFVFLCFLVSLWSFVNVALIFFCPEDHVPD